MPARVRELTGGRGVDVVYDGIGKDTFEGSLDALRVRGTSGALRGRFGAGAAVRPAAAQRPRIPDVTRPKIDDFLLDAEERRWRSEEIFGLVANGTLKVNIGARFPLSRPPKPTPRWSPGRRAAKSFCSPLRPTTRAKLWTESK